MSQFKVLQAATTLSEVALLLGVKPGMLSFQLYKKPKLTLYSKFEIPKRLGGTREIWAPEKDLKLLQHRLVDLLQNCIDEINAAKPEHAKETDKHPARRECRASGRWHF